MAMDRRQRRIIKPPGFNRLLTGGEDPSGFGDVFNTALPPRVQKLAEVTWDKLMPTKWEQMKLAKPEVLNMHMAYVAAYLKVGFDPDKAIREVSNGRLSLEDVTTSGKAHHERLVLALRYAISDYPA